MGSDIRLTLLLVACPCLRAAWPEQVRRRPSTPHGLSCDDGASLGDDDVQHQIREWPIMFSWGGGGLPGVAGG